MASDLTPEQIKRAQELVHAVEAEVQEICADLLGCPATPHRQALLCLRIQEVVDEALERGFMQKLVRAEVDLTGHTAYVSFHLREVQE